MLLSVGHFKMFKPHRKAFFKKHTMDEKNNQKHSCPFKQYGNEKYYHKKEVHSILLESFF